MTMHRKMAETLDTVIEEIKEIQREAREEGKTERPFWPMIVLRTPKLGLVGSLARMRDYIRRSVEVREFLPRTK